MINVTMTASDAREVRAVKSDYHEAVIINGGWPDRGMSSTLYLVVPAGTAERIAGILNAGIEAEKAVSSLGKLESI